jgi:hypothetical protein
MISSTLALRLNAGSIEVPIPESIDEPCDESIDEPIDESIDIDPHDKLSSRS